MFRDDSPLRIKKHTEKHLYINRKLALKSLPIPENRDYYRATTVLIKNKQKTTTQNNSVDV